MTPKKIMYDGSKECKNLILAICERMDISAFVSRQGMVVGEKDEHLIKKGKNFEYFLTVKD